MNQDVVRDPSLVLKDPYKAGWICVIKSPEIATNLNNLMQGTLVAPWMQNAVGRLSMLTAKLGATATADGGLPASGLLVHLEPGVQRTLIHEFFLT